MSKIRPMFDESNLADKKWCDAFIEYYGDVVEYKQYATADALLVKESVTCTTYQMLMQYVLQFENGGFWLADGRMYVVTRGFTSDDDATYEDAIKFIVNWKRFA